MSRTILPYGDRALLAEVGDLGEALGLFSALSAARPDGVVDIVPGERTVTVILDPARMPLERARAWISGVTASPTAPAAATAVTIDVDYSGEDLAEVAQLLGVGADEVIERHTSRDWRVAFCGFTPGFAYLVSGADGLTVPRRSTPRTAVPAGSVALAGEYSGIYPRRGPGGWQIIGRSDAVLWNPAGPEPALLVPGRTVRFRRAS